MSRKDGNILIGKHIHKSLTEGGVRVTRIYRYCNRAELALDNSPFLLLGLIS